MSKSNLTLGDLAKAKGILQLKKTLGGSDEDYAKMLVMSNKYLKDHPDLAALSVGISGSGAFYDHNRRRIGLHNADPNILAHELGHAVDLGGSSSLYNEVITPYSKKLTRALSHIALPASVALAASTLEEQKKQRYFNYAKGVAALAAAPNLLNEIRATHIAAKMSPNYGRTMASLSPGLILHGATSLTPLSTFMGVDYIRGKQGPVANIVARSLGMPALPPTMPT